MTLALLLFLAQDVPAPVAEEIRKLRSDDFEVRSEAERKFAGLGKDAVPALEALLKDPDADIVTHAKAILAEIDKVARLRALREPAKRTSVQIDGIHPNEALRQTFEPFGIKARLIEGRDDPAWKVTWRLENATFWEAYDKVWETAHLMGGNVPSRPAGDTKDDLQFGGPFDGRGRESMATVGDYRIMASPGRITPRSGPKRVGVTFFVVCPSWAVPKKTRVADVALADVKIGMREPFDDGPKRINNPALSGCIRRIITWESEDSVPRSALTDGKSVKLSGTLVMTIGDQENALPFTIPALPVPPE